MGNNSSKCDLEFYQEYYGEVFDFRNILPYGILYGIFQLLAFLTMFFDGLEKWAFYVRGMYKASRITYMSEGNLMYSW